ncbi:YkgJ family cysteine cluster protein [Roseibacillus ishigakijimensis]|uniref:YkgJ family cysteine cluster protein n=1 Tax=Roseibacillus ishigakijimensis TaxID=454146 RepID=A0A934VMA9_9BACT|nr:YkgJ family cysteine cluster protein [Roseibacillus ishigakijimensis]MBK1835564.1 YkgJ family cysteine cluster protein [Roseibacillus ishigakijimensis]
MAAATHKGVYYVCQRCTACCRWPGDVVLEEGEAEKIAAYLELPLDAFIQEHTQLSANRRHLSLKENPDHSCVWLEGNDCTLQAVKPSQCAGFPNKWNFKGWKSYCEAIPVPLDELPAESGD